MGTSDTPSATPDLPAGDVLLAIDGEPHTDMAVRWSLRLAAALGRRIVAVHVKDPYLKQFYNEIYAQGRQEYLDHVDACLDEIAAEALDRFEKAAEDFDVAWSHKLRLGNPAEELLDEIRQDAYGLLVIGARIPAKSRGRWRKGLVVRLASAVVDVPLLVVPAEE